MRKADGQQRLVKLSRQIGALKDIIHFNVDVFEGTINEAFEQNLQS